MEKILEKSLSISVLKTNKWIFVLIHFFGILSLSSHFDMKTMNIISSDVQTNLYKLLRTKSKEIVDALRLLELLLFDDLQRN